MKYLIAALLLIATPVLAKEEPSWIAQVHLNRCPQIAIKVNQVEMLMILDRFSRDEVSDENFIETVSQLFEGSFLAIGDRVVTPAQFATSFVTSCRGTEQKS